MKRLARLFKSEKKMSIEFCEKNLDRFLAPGDMEAYNRFLGGKNIVYKEYKCQSKCEKCKLSPYAMADGQFVSADTPAGLLEKLTEMAGK